MRENSRAKGDIFVKIAFRESITAELELGRVDISQVSVEDSEGVELSNMVSSNLICTNQKLNLWNTF
jgi:hypothetical protein